MCKISKRCTLPGTTAQIISAGTEIQNRWVFVLWARLCHALACLDTSRRRISRQKKTQKIRKKSAKNPQKNRKRTLFQKVSGSGKKNTGNSEMYNQFKHFFKLRPFAVFCVRFAFFLRPFAVLNFPHNLRSGHCSSKFIAAVHIGKPTWHCYGLECDLSLQIHLRPCSKQIT